MATSAIKSIQKLAEQHRVPCPSRLKQEPCGPTALEGLSSHWHDIGTSLKLPLEKLSHIEKEFVGDDRRFFEVISSYKDEETIKDAVSKLNNPRYIEIINVYQKEFWRIPVQPGYHKQLLPKYDSCYEEWWLDRVEFEPFPLRYTEVHENDLKDIVAVIMEHCPTKWYEIGLYLGIHKGTLDIIDHDNWDTSRRVIEMVSVWINTKKSTWQDLIYVLKKLKFIQENPDIAPLKNEEVQYRNLNDNFIENVRQHKEAISRKKRSTLQGLCGLLNVAGDVSDEDLIVGMGHHIRDADLNLEQIREVARLLESLEGCMKEHSTTLKTWVVELKQDLETARNVQTKLFTRKQKLEVFQSSLEKKREKIAEFSGMSVMSHHLGKERLETEDKLRYIKEEIKACVKELDRANADYWAISEKLNKCQIELRDCVDEYQKLLEILNSIYPSWWWTPWRLFGRVPWEAPIELYFNCRRIIDSCVEQLEENRREIQAIQDVLNIRNPGCAQYSQTSPYEYIINVQ